MRIQIVGMSIAFLLFLFWGCSGTHESERSGPNAASPKDRESEENGAPREKLIGSFVSAKKETMAFLNSSDQYDASQLNALENALVDLELTFEKTTRTSRIGEKTSIHNYHVIESGANHVIIRCDFSAKEAALMGKKSETKRVEFTQDGFWLSDSELGSKRFKEKFRRMGPRETD